MGKIDYKAIYDRNKHGWYDMTEDPQKYEALLAGHYSDSNHFVYELIQNAEDAFEVNSKGVFDPKTCAYADKVVIEYYEDKLIFYHNGKPFDEDDVRGVSSMLMGTKDKDDGQTIGRFGMGFKSVFKYTYQPEIYSDNEAFKITSYLLPEEINDAWDYEKEKKDLVCTLGEGEVFAPFAQSQHLTKIVIPFYKYGKDGSLISVSGKEVLKKLEELNGEILLFLSHIKYLYWVNRENGKYVYISLTNDEKDKRVINCRINGTDFLGKEDVSKYLLFKKAFDHKEMAKAEVAIAYRLNSRGDNINEITNHPPIWVFFPTKDTTDLPFIIHGSFETAVSREKLMSPSLFNDDLFKVLGDLVADSMLELAKRKLITQGFLRRSLMAAFKDEISNETIPGLKEKITRIIKKNGLMPDRDGHYKKPSQLLLPVPHRIAEFVDKRLIGKALDGKLFAAFNNEREANFSEYYNWLVQDLNISIYSLAAFAKDLGVVGGAKVPTSGELYESVKDLYSFLTDNLKSVYDTGLKYTRSGPYEQEIRNGLSSAWTRLKKAPIVLNRLNTLVPSMVDGKTSIYLGSSSEYKSVKAYDLVEKTVANNFKPFLTEGLGIAEFNNFQFVKENVIAKYIDIEDQIGFKDQDNYSEEYLEDLGQIFSLMDETKEYDEIRSLLKNAYIIKVRPDGINGKEDTFALPSECYIPISEEGIDLEVYYAPVYKGRPEFIGGTYTEDDYYDDTENIYNFNYFAIDTDYYEKNGISISKLSRLGLITSPVDEGEKSANGYGDGYWRAVGEYCPELSVDALKDNLLFISMFKDWKLAKRKSAEILKLLLIVAYKLRGQRYKRKTNPYLSEVEYNNVLTDIRQRNWLYNADMELVSPKDISKYELSYDIYGDVSDKYDYSILGFVEKKADEKREFIQKVNSLDEESQRELVLQLARNLGLTISEDDNLESDDSSKSEYFNPNDWEDDEFPERKVNNPDYLIRHVKEQFFCADPKTYQKVWRQICVSKNTKADRAYAIGMYTNSRNMPVCQMCKKTAYYPEVCQIANYGIEMSQLNICLCRECAAKYYTFRDVNKNVFKENMKDKILKIDTYHLVPEYQIELDSNTSITLNKYL